MVVFDAIVTEALALFPHAPLSESVELAVHMGRYSLPYICPDPHFSLS
jgi:hypothetical protein